jgi:hypothetical protein
MYSRNEVRFEAELYQTNAIQSKFSAAKQD